MPVFIYYAATSLDGFIATSTGGVDWLNHFHDVDYGFVAFVRQIDCAVMGRTTYEHTLKLGPPPMKIRTVVLSSQRKSGPHADEFWSGSLSDLAAHLEATGAKRVWVMGGGITASAFVDAGLLDEVSLHIMPVILGAGIPAFARSKVEKKLQLLETKSFKNGVLHLRYAVAR
jgi:dihydrofolate reductase